MSHHHSLLVKNLLYRAVDDNYWDRLPGDLQVPIMQMGNTMGNQLAVNEEIKDLLCRNARKIITDFQEDTNSSLKLIKEVMEKHGVPLNPEYWGKKCWAVYQTLIHLDERRQGNLNTANKLKGICTKPNLEEKEKQVLNQVLVVLNDLNATGDQTYDAFMKLEKETLGCLGY